MARKKKQPLDPRQSSGKLPKVRRKKPEETCFSFTAQALDQARIQLTEALEDRRQLQQRLIAAENHIDDVAEGMEDTFDNERRGFFAALDRAYERIAASAKTNAKLNRLNSELTYKLERALMELDGRRGEPGVSDETRRRSNRLSNWVWAGIWLVLVGFAGWLFVDIAHFVFDWTCK